MSRQPEVIGRGPRRPMAGWRRTALALALLGACGAVWAEVTARLDRDSVPLGQPLTLTIESSGKSTEAQPDLGPLRKDFELLGTSKSSETRIVNFHRSDRVRWTVQLMPRRLGSIEVPALSVGTEQTAALALQVAEPTTAASAAPAGDGQGTAVFMEVQSPAAGKPVYVQQQVPYTVRVYIDGSVQSGELSAPSSPDAVIEQLGEDQRSSATVGGRDYTVIERHYAIAPEKSGTLQIAPASFRGNAVVAQGAGRDQDPRDDMMANLLRNTPFANDPTFRSRLFGGMSMGVATRPVGASARALTLDVRARPAAAQGHWLPAEQIRLHDSWADAAPTFKAGEPVSRTLTIEAKGLAASQIPALTLAQPANARVYADAPDNQSRTDGTTIYGISKQTLSYIPSAAGTLDVAPVELPWWDTHDNVQRHAELAALSFQVEPGAAPSAAGATPAPSTSARPVAPSVTPSADVQAPWPQRAAEALRGHWQVLASSSLALLLAGALAWSLRRRRSTPSGAKPVGPATAQPGVRASRRALQRACHDGDRHAAARALLDLARAEWPDHPPRGLGELAQRLDAGADEVRVLDRSLYGGASGDWDGMALWRSLAKGLRPTQQASPGRAHDALAPLYP